jgi:hypothetical protein
VFVVVVMGGGGGGKQELEERQLETWQAVVFLSAEF